MNPFLIKQGANLISQPVDKAVLDRLAEAVKESRKSLGLSQRDFANLLGCSQGAVQGWEAGRNPPNLENLEAIARVRGQRPDEFVAYLYGVSGEPSLQERIKSMDQAELSWLLMLIAQQMAK